MSEPLIPNDESTLIYAIEVADRAGVANSVAAVFAERGLSMESLVAETGRMPSRMLVAFRGTARQCHMVEQVLHRLHHVLSVRSLPTDAPELRAVAWFRPRTQVPTLAGVTMQRVGDCMLISGSYAAVDAAIARLGAENLACEVSRSLVAL